MDREPDEDRRGLPPGLAAIDPAPPGVNRYYPGLTVLRELPRPWANAAYQQFFFARWKRDLVVINAAARVAEYPDFEQPLSLKCSLAGTKSYRVGARSVAIDESTYMVMNPAVYGSTMNSHEPVHSFIVHFPPELVREAVARVRHGDRSVLDDASPRDLRFGEHVRLRCGGLSRSIRRVIATLQPHSPDPDAVRTEAHRMLDQMLLGEARTQGLSAPAAPSTGHYREIVKRIYVARDYIHSNYLEPVRVSDVARAAGLSEYHLIGQFRRVAGDTPHRYLNRCRLARALHLLRTTRLPAAEVAVAAGFESRVTLHRNCRSLLGMAPGQAARLEADPWAPWLGAPEPQFR